MTDTLQALYASTADLYARFGLDATTTPPNKRRKLFAEEADELKEASIVSDCMPYWIVDEPKADIANEAADVFVTVVGLLLAHAVEREDFDAAIQRVIDKNDAKTAANGYAVIAGKIRKATP